MSASRFRRALRQLSNPEFYREQKPPPCQFLFLCQNVFSSAEQDPWKRRPLPLPPAACRAPSESVLHGTCFLPTLSSFNTWGTACSLPAVIARHAVPLQFTIWQ